MIPIRSASDQAAGLRAGRPARRHRSLAITSGKGGVGKTSVAVNLGLLLARAGHPTCLLDGDLGLANVDVLLNLHPRRSLRDVLFGGESLLEAVEEGPAGLRVLSATSGVEALAELSPETRRSLLERLPSLGALGEFTILDTGAGISATVLGLVLAADEVVLLTTPEPTAMTDAYAVLKVATRRRPALPVRLLVNGSSHAAEAHQVHEHLDRISRRFLGRELPLLGWVPRDECVERAVREQRPLALYYPYARATAALRELAGRLLLHAGAGEGSTESQFWERVLSGAEEL